MLLGWSHFPKFESGSADVDVLEATWTLKRGCFAFCGSEQLQPKNNNFKITCQPKLDMHHMTLIKVSCNQVFTLVQRVSASCEINSATFRVVSPTGSFSLFILTQHERTDSF